MAFNVEEEMEKLVEELAKINEEIGNDAAIEACHAVTLKWIGEAEMTLWECESVLNEANWDEFERDCRDAWGGLDITLPNK